MSIFVKGHRGAEPDTTLDCITYGGQIGTQEDELPVSLLLLGLDHCLNLSLGELLAGVFLSVGDDDHDNAVGPRFGGHLGQTLVKVVDPPPHGIEERRTGARDKGLSGEFLHIGDGGELADDFIGILGVELDKGEGGLAGFGLLFLEEGIESADDVVTDGLHGAGTVEDDSNVDVVVSGFGFGFCFHGGIIA